MGSNNQCIEFDLGDKRSNPIGIISNITSYYHQDDVLLQHEALHVRIKLIIVRDTMHWSFFSFLDS